MPSARISNTTPYTTYKMWVTAKNAIGEGETAGPVSAQFNCGQWADIDYNENRDAYFDYPDNPFADGRDFTVISFTRSGTLTVKGEGMAHAFIMSCGGSGGRGANNNGTHSSGGGGGGGGNIYDTTLDQGIPFYLAEGTYDIVVGEHTDGQPGGNTEAFGITVYGGRQGGSRVGGQSANWMAAGSGTNQYHAGGGGGGGYTQAGHSANGSAPGGQGVQRDFTGTSTWYCTGGSGGGSMAYGPSGSVNEIGGAGGGGNAEPNSGAGGGGSNQGGTRGAGGSGIVMLRLER